MRRPGRSIHEVVIIRYNSLKDELYEYFFAIVIPIPVSCFAVYLFGLSGNNKREK